MPSVKQEALHGVKWTAIRSFGNRAFQFLLGIILARLLTPADYGTVGMATIFFSIAGLLIDSGLTAALIRKKDATCEDISTVFFFNIVASGVCCALIVIFSPQIAAFLNAPVLEDIVKVTAFSMFIGSFGSVHWTLMTKAVDFKTPALIQMPISVLTGILSVVMAYSGFGVWSLVWPSFVGTCLSMIVVWRVSKWRPRFVFSTKSFKEFFAFSGNLVLNSFLDKFFNEGIGMLIGKYYTPAQLGFYTKGKGTAELPSTFLYNMVGGVTFPVLSKIQDDEETLRRVYGKFMRILSMVIFFCMILLVAIARPLVLFLYTAKWEPAIIFLQLFCLQCMLYHIHAINWNFLLVKGRTDWAFKKEVINKSIKITLLVSAIPFGPLYICLALVASSVFDLFVNTIVTGCLFDYGVKKQFGDFIPYLLLSVLCCAPAWAIQYLDLSQLVTLLLQVTVSFGLYVSYLYFTKNNDFFELLRISPLKRFVR